MDYGIGTCWIFSADFRIQKVDYWHFKNADIRRRTQWGQRCVCSIPGQHREFFFLWTKFSFLSPLSSRKRFFYVEIHHLAKLLAPFAKEDGFEASRQRQNYHLIKVRNLFSQNNLYKESNLPMLSRCSQKCMVQFYEKKKIITQPHM